MYDVLCKERVLSTHVKSLDTAKTYVADPTVARRSCKGVDKIQSLMSMTCVNAVATC